MRIVLATGGFDPIHSGHIDYFNAAKKLGDILIVGINSDTWLTQKKGQPFMPWDERYAIISNLKCVDKVISFDDSTNSSHNAIYELRKQYPNDTIIFVNGGDRNSTNIPETNIVDDKLEFVYGVGGDFKKNSSSWILREWKHPKTLRDWGYYRILHEVPGLKVKELTIDPNKSMSMQRHFKRSEYWIVSEGMCDVQSIMPTGYQLPTITLSEHNSYTVPLNDWHKISNPYKMPCRIVEIQYGEMCIEEDIERKTDA